MARLFIGQREIELINDLVREFTKDVIGQVIYYFPLSAIKSSVDTVYNEAIKKMFEQPVKIAALVGQPEWSTKTTAFGPDVETKIEVLIQHRDLVDKGITLSEGDMFSFDDVFYEILSCVNMNNIFGMAEYNNAWKITAKNARVGQFDPSTVFVPNEHPNQAARAFEQQRGLAVSDSTGEPTGDRRQVRERLGRDMAPVALGTGQRRVEAPEPGTGGDPVSGDTATAFNNDPPPPSAGIYDDDGVR